MKYPRKKKKKNKSNRRSSDLHFSRSFPLHEPANQPYFANHPIGQNHYSGRGNENIQTGRSPLRMPAVNRRRLPRNRRRGRFFVASITLLTSSSSAVPRCVQRLGCAKQRRLLHRGTIRILIKKDRRGRHRPTN